MNEGDRLVQSVHSLICAMALLGSSVRPQEDSRLEDRPNFVVIMADDLGYGDIGCYGSTLCKTPHIDAIASAGLRFTDFHSSGAVCSPTRAGLVTGRYQQRASIPGVVYADPKRPEHRHGLQPREVTFAETLRDAGYATALIGKWHLGYEPRFNPTQHGFEIFRGYVSGNVDYRSHVDNSGTHDWWDGSRNIHEEGYVTHLITHHAVKFLEENAQQPFCLYIAHEAVHSPYQGPNDPAGRKEGGGRLTKNRARDNARAYREMTEEMDKSVGEVLAALRRLGHDRDTLVFFFSDNGANPRGSNGPLRGRKGQIWEGGHRVPCIAYMPGRIKPGTTAAATMTIDIMPTLLALAGEKAPDGHRFDGISLEGLLFGGKPIESRSLFWEVGSSQAMRQGDWKLVIEKAGQKGAKSFLFDLESDLAEKNDLAQEHPDRVKKMRTVLAEWAADVHEGSSPQPGGER